MSKNQKPRKVESLQTHKSNGSMKITFSGSHAIQAPLSSWIEEQFLGLRGREIKKKKKNYSITLVNQIDAITVCGSNDSVLLILRCYDLNLSNPTIFLTQQSESFKLFPCRHSNYSLTHNESGSLTHNESGSLIEFGSCISD